MTNENVSGEIGTGAERRPRRLIGALAGAVVLSLAPVPFGSSVSAHANLESSDPSPSAVLEESPTEIFLDFDEPVKAASDSVRLYDQTGGTTELGAPTVSAADPTVMVTPIPADLPDGLYVVSWKVASSDGHVAQGAYTFQVGEVASDVDTGALLNGVLSRRGDPTGISNLFVIVRLVVYAAIAVLLGTLAMVGAGVVDGRRTWRLVFGSSTAAVIGTVLLFLMQSAYVAGEWSGAFDGDRWSEVLDTRLGVALVARFVLLAVLVVLSLAVVDAAERRSTSWWRSSTTVVAAGVVTTFAAAGHPSAAPLAGVAVAVDAVHLGGVALWFGGLVSVVIGDGRERGAVRWFSRVATVTVPLVVVTGLWQTWRLGGGLGELSESDWGRAILLKSALVVAAATLGAFGRWIVHRDESAPLRRLVSVEAGFAVAVLATTSFLVARPPEAEVPAAVFATTISQGSLIADVTVTPGTVGANEVHVILSPAGGTLERYESVTMRFLHPDPSLPPVTAQVVEEGPNHFTGRIALLSPGTWTLEVLAQPDQFTSVRLTAEVPIAG